VVRYKRIIIEGYSVSRQLSLSDKIFNKPKDVFGGSLLTSNPKVKRPLHSKLPILLTLRAEKSCLRKLGALHRVNKLVYFVAKRHGVRIYKYSNVGNHLHLLIKIPHVHRWAAFIRELTGRIAQELIGELKLPDQLRFWKFRPHTRIVRGWQKAYRIAKEYIYLNQLEADGCIDRKQIHNLRALKQLLQI
jgi:REP element-mobilizing transposase RayT